MLHDAQVQLVLILLFTYTLHQNYPFFLFSVQKIKWLFYYRNSGYVILLPSLLHVIINGDYLLSTARVCFFAVSTLNVGALSIVLALSATASHYQNNSQTIISSWLMMQPFLNPLLSFSIGKTALSKLLSMFYGSHLCLATTSLFSVIFKCPNTRYLFGFSSNISEE